MIILITFLIEELIVSDTLPIKEEISKNKSINYIKFVCGCYQ